MNKRILMVLTSHDRLGDTGERTGYWLEEFAAPCYVFRDAGASVTLASPRGGRPPCDPKSTAAESRTGATLRLDSDVEAQARLDNTRVLAGVDLESIDAVFYPGGHGPLWDLVPDEHSIRLIETLVAADKPVAAVCHGPAVFLHARNPDGSCIVEDKDVTGFSNSEETAVGLADAVPMLLESSLIAKGGRYRKAGDFEPLACRDGKLITGQNPASSVAAAEHVLAALD